MFTSLSCIDYYYLNYFQVNGSHRNETEPPNASFFELEPRGAAKSSTATSTCSTIIQPSKQERDSSEFNEVQV